MIIVIFYNYYFELELDPLIHRCSILKTIPIPDTNQRYQTFLRNIIDYLYHGLGEYRLSVKKC